MLPGINQPRDLLKHPANRLMVIVFCFYAIVASTVAAAADPNPFVNITRNQEAEVTVSWHAGTGAMGQLYVLGDGLKETLFAGESSGGTSAVPWINPASNYEFRLYEGSSHTQLLASAKISKKTKIPETAKTAENKPVQPASSLYVSSGAFRYVPLISVALLVLGWVLARRFDRGELPGRPPAPKTSIRRSFFSASTLVLLVAVVTYVWTASWNIAVPGFEYDELIQILPAFEFVHGPLTSNIIWYSGTKVALFGHTMPLMTMAYIGSVKTIAFIPVAWGFGITPESVRYFTIGLGAMALLATFGFVRNLMGRQVAAITTLLLATDSTFIFYTRTDWGPVAVGMVLKGLALWALTSWWKTRRNVLLFWGCFALGVGVYDKANFVWVVGGLAGAIVLVALPGVWARVKLKQLICGTLGFTAGVLPFVWFNVVWPLQTLTVQKNLEASHRADILPGGLLEQLWHRAGVLATLLDGKAVDGHWVARPMLNAHWHILSTMLAISALLIVIRCLIRVTRPEQGPAAFVLATLFLILTAAAMTPLGYQFWHVISAYPFPHIIMAYGLVTFAGWLSGLVKAGEPKHAIQSALTGIFCLFLVMVNFVSTRDIYRELVRTGGHSFWSDLVNQLTAYLLEEPDKPVVSLDWGIHFPLVGISQGRLKCEDYPNFTQPDGSAQDFVRVFSVPANRYVLHPPNQLSMRLPRRNFFEQAKLGGYKPVLQKAFFTRDGAPVFEVYTVEAIRREVTAGTPQ